MGITMIEKHFILDRSLGGPDAAFSMEPKEFKLMVERVREVEKALGIVDYEMNEKNQITEFYYSDKWERYMKPQDITTYPAYSEKENKKSIQIPEIILTK
jgi:pseudaminic acid synthase